jgi:hypothetical protein
MKPNKSLCSATAAPIDFKFSRTEDSSRDDQWRPGTASARMVLDIKIEKNHRGVPEPDLAEAVQGG